MDHFSLHEVGRVVEVEEDTLQASVEEDEQDGQEGEEDTPPAPELRLTTNEELRVNPVDVKFLETLTALWFWSLSGNLWPKDICSCFIFRVKLTNLKFIEFLPVLLLVKPGKPR